MIMLWVKTIHQTALRLGFLSGKDANTSAAFFCFGGTMSQAHFSKPPLSSSDLVNLMRARGLEVPDPRRAERHLRLVGYYRLMGYGKSFFDSTSQTFYPGTTYDTIWNAYKFDRKLRLLTLDAIERIEVAIRTAISNEMSITHGPHWVMEPSLFKTPKDCSAVQASLQQDLKNKSHEIVVHYYQKYNSPPLPPSWMIMECISMGAWINILKRLKQPEQKRISTAFALPYVSLVSWASSLAWTRNVCAHHGVLWTRPNTKPPKTPQPGMQYPNIGGKESTYFATAVISYGFLKRIVTKSTWADRLFSLFEEFPTVNISAMGFSPNWKQDKFWQ